MSNDRSPCGATPERLVRLADVLAVINQPQDLMWNGAQDWLCDELRKLGTASESTLKTAALEELERATSLPSAERFATPQTDAYHESVSPAEITKHPMREFAGAMEFARQLERDRDGWIETCRAAEDALERRTSSSAPVTDPIRILNRQLSEATYPSAAPAARLTSAEASVINNLIATAEYVERALEDGAEELPDGSMQIDEPHSNALCLALAVLDDLPDDKPGVTLCGPGRAKWALRRLLEAPSASSATPVATDAFRKVAGQQREADVQMLRQMARWPEETLNAKAYEYAADMMSKNTLVAPPDRQANDQ